MKSKRISGMLANSESNTFFASGGGTLNVLGGSLLVNYAANGFGIGDGSAGALNLIGQILSNRGVSGYTPTPTPTPTP